MTPDQRLDQLEPMIAEAMTILDRHTAQLKQLSSAVGQLTEVVTLQSSNISFILREQIVMKADIAELKADVAGLKTDVAGLKTDVAGLKTDVAGLKADMAGLKAGQISTNEKLDLILSKLK
ncbi:hypothetical protein H8B15_18825 [Hymenobacter sp. BT507]|uniref:Uncharacterized protein n=1 Tax=Hymenobacter citatus TaxID=2763506 RepID=A0ABR7MPI5_9BACT|nr:hypothetical protein [Hymenobacter citatus]MBC6612983.1 hypothetical protein [Hymenobacter citatus]